MTLLVRYSSLGDIVLAASITAALAPVAFLTHRRYHELVSRFPGVTRLLAPGDPLPTVTRVIDLHNNLRSRRIRAHARVDRQDLRRRMRVWFKTRPADPVLERYSHAAGVAPSALPWLPPVTRGDTLLLAPGAAHASKVWPFWDELADAWGGPVRGLGGPDDAPVVPGVYEAGFTRTLEAMEGGAVLCGNDTGLLHLGAAVGLPVVGIFGPTTSADGFFSYGGTAVETDLYCRPCARFGRPDCPVGDHACMRRISVDEVLAACRRAYKDA